MYWPFKTTVKFTTDSAQEIRLEYLRLGEQEHWGQM